jgi:hypothetical protein
VQPSTIITKFPCLIQSEEICRQLLEDFSKIKIRQGTPVLPRVMEGVNIPENLLLSERGSRRLLKGRATYAFDLYLLLLRKSQEAKSHTISVDFASLKNELGCRNILRPRIRLDRTYDLIRYDAGKRQVTILDLSRKEKRLIPSDGEHRRGFILPFEYWGYGFARRLSLRAKYMYLVALLEAEKSTKNPYWFRSEQDLARLYGVSDYTISLGLQELEKEDIIEINRSISEKDEYGDRKANIYCLNPLISPEEFEKKMNELTERYGNQAVSRARGLSAQLNEPNDLYDIETFVHLIQEFGYDRVKEANDVTVTRKKGSGLWDISHTIRLLKGER